MFYARKELLWTAVRNSQRQIIKERACNGYKSFYYLKSENTMMIQNMGEIIYQNIPLNFKGYFGIMG